MEMIIPAQETTVPQRDQDSDRDLPADQAVLTAFGDNGWIVEPVEHGDDSAQPDFIARRGDLVYAVEIKTASEGRLDRLIPLWSQACLQAMSHASHGVPLVVVAAPRISAGAAEKVLEFAARYASGVAAGVVDFAGMRRFQGSGLSSLAADPTGRGVPLRAPTAGADLFSDLNQWMLKVLLAPELPEHLLYAPRERLRNPTQLARAAGVSAMSAHRFVQQLGRDGYLDSYAGHLRLVERVRLFRQWEAAAARRVKELPVRVLLGDAPVVEAARLSQERNACLALFAAADALGLGFVHGVPPYVYVRHLPHAAGSAQSNLAPAGRYELPDLVLRQPTTAESVFRGMVTRDGVSVSDVIQVWLDVSAHPSRGSEQADFIRSRVLQPLFSEVDTW